MYITRFGPSPSGLMHIGNLRTAFITWLMIRKKKGLLILRIDNTNIIKSNKKYIRYIKEDLKWIGIKWQKILEQFYKKKQYYFAINILKITKKLYPCYENNKELLYKKIHLLKKKKFIIYNRFSLFFKDKKNKKYWRFLLKNNNIFWKDECKDKIIIRSYHLNDPIILKKNGNITYTLASVVDDITYKINYILRGEDHITSTSIHIQIFKSLGYIIPEFSHVVLFNLEKKKMSKRINNFSIYKMRKKGFLPKTLQIYFTKIKKLKLLSINNKFNNMLSYFNIKKNNIKKIYFIKNDLYNLNNLLLLILKYKIVFFYFKKYNLIINKNFWFIIKKNLKTLKDIKIWWKIFYKNISNKIIDKNLINITKNEIPIKLKNNSFYYEWIKKIKKKTNKRGKKLFIPLRFLLTGVNCGPKLSLIIYLIDKYIIFKRLNII